MTLRLDLGDQELYLTGSLHAREAEVAHCFELC